MTVCRRSAPGYTHHMDGASRHIGYLLTDIDGSTERWERMPAQMAEAVGRHNRIIDELVSRCGGVVRDHAGDGVFAAFDRGDPLQCAVEIQLALQQQDWSAVGGLAVRIGVHAGYDRFDQSYQQVAINRAARIAESAWGGQIIVSAEAVNAFSLPANSWLTDLGHCRLKGIEEPLRLFNLAQREMRQTDFPPPRTVAPAGSALSLSAPVFGRERECDDLKALLSAERTRIVSLVGAGGNGKTLLAVHLGARFQEQLPVWFVSLEAATDEHDLIAAVARALHFPLYEAAPPLEQIADYLADKRGLLILDNADTIAEQAGRFIAAIERRCGSMKILTTSRAPLEIARAAVYRLSGLPMPGSTDAELTESAAFRLVNHEARSGNPDHAFEKLEYDAFRELCQVVHGSPLALRLAAQWRRILPTSEIVARIRTGLDFLRTRESDIPDRQRSIRSVFAGSWTLLSEDERRGLARLSIFSGGFDALGAEGAGGLPLSILLRLEQNGLIERAGGDRFILHPLVKEYAREALASSGAEIEARSQHANYYLRFARAEFENARSLGQNAVLERIEREHTNIVEAWRHALVSKRWAEIHDAAECLFYALVLRGRYGDATTLFRQRADDPATDAYLNSLLANCLVQLGELDRALDAANIALKLGGSAHAQAHAHHALGLAAHARGDMDSALVGYQTALDIRSGLRDAYGCFYSNASLAILHMLRNDHETARTALIESFRLSEASANQTGLMIVHSLAADLAALEGRLEDAKAGYRRSLEFEQTVHHPQHRARVLTKLGGVLTRMGAYASAIRHHREALDCANRIGDVRHRIEALLAIGGALRNQGQHEKAKVRLIQAARLALRLDARPFLIRCLLDLATLEADTGNSARAQELASVLAGAELGQCQNAYQALRSRLPALAPSKAEHMTPEALVGELVSEADTAMLRL